MNSKAHWHAHPAIPDALPRSRNSAHCGTDWRNRSREHWGNKLTIRAGDPAPDFTLVATDGAPLSLESLRGAKVLLWFYVAAGTPGCTLEGRGFRDHQSYFDESNIRVVG